MELDGLGDRAMLGDSDRTRHRMQSPCVCTLVAILACVVVFAYLHQSNAVAAEKGNKDAAASRAAFLEVYKVLMHPRCMNCHPNGDQPLQGNDSHVHTMNVKRGDEGTGKYAMK